MKNLRSVELVDLVVTTLEKILRSDNEELQIQGLTVYSKLVDAFKGTAVEGSEGGEILSEGLERVNDGLGAEMDRLRRLGEIPVAPTLPLNSDGGVVLSTGGVNPAGGESV